MCGVLDLLLRTMYGHPINPHQLDRFVEIALQKGVEAGWENSYIKKFHWMLHFGDSYRNHSTLIATWAMERKHKRITSVANCYTNLSRYEQAIYVEILGEELHRLKAQNLPAAGLVKFGQAPKAFIAFVFTIVPPYIWKMVGKQALVMFF